MISGHNGGTITLIKFTCIFKDSMRIWLHYLIKLLMAFDCNCILYIVFTKEVLLYTLIIIYLFDSITIIVLMGIHILIAVVSLHHMLYLLVCLMDSILLNGFNKSPFA